MAVCGAYSIRPYPDGRNSIHFFAHSASGVAVCGAYAVAPYTDDKNLVHFLAYSASGVAVCGAYSIRPYPEGRKFIGVEVHFYPEKKKIAIFPGIRVGAYCIRPTDDHGSDRMSGKTGVFGIRF